MKGRRVERRFGWDTHGLPAELEAERILGITDKSQIDEMGIAAFNDACRTSVLKYTKEWEEYVERQARWVDFEHDYKTLDVTFMESVLWAFKQLHDKGLAYEGYRVLPYCWRDETPCPTTSCAWTTTCTRRARTRRSRSACAWRVRATARPRRRLRPRCAPSSTALSS
ncbi:hypothetical protein GCM10025864_42830 [Luteimicrobium album]|uniref:Aminoacyl-tRNA synthetase class Ia domain-containing protein n=2 Tax=Luteimicrobium album TaxID=1054550 RepID=A0ABQ6IA05_9MICO|nr:hypothetical protein GCM10025864_42830 [Luteimicrobium album]